MSVLRISPALAKKMDIHELQEQSFVSKVLNWILDWRYRKSVALSPWLANQTQSNISLKSALSEISTIKSYDLQVVEVQKWVINNITYKRDKEVWDVGEKWQTAEETVKLRTGDCEDGAVLIYVLSRFKGVPVNRLGIMAGNVKGGGHAWCVYRPELTPLNFVFLDWCYWAKTAPIASRNLFYVKKQEITEYVLEENNYVLIDDQSNYYNIWFIFNEEKANTEVKYNFKQIGGKLK